MTTLTREAAVWLLGLTDSPTDDEVLSAYRDKCQPLKRKLVRATSVEDKNKRAQDIRALQRARDLLIGRKPKPRGEQLRLQWRPLLYELDDVRIETLTRKKALKALGLSHYASDEAALDAYRVRYRVLTRALGAAKTQIIMAALRDARAKMRAIREFLESVAFETDTMHTDDLVGATDTTDTGEVGPDTLTDELEIQG